MALKLNVTRGVTIAVAQTPGVEKQLVTAIVMDAKITVLLLKVSFKSRSSDLFWPLNQR